MERSNLESIENRIEEIRKFFLSTEIPQNPDPKIWYDFLKGLKIIQGNSNNDISFIATLMAKDYLTLKFGPLEFDAALKPQGAPGLDIDINLQNGKRLIAEIKTTIPYKDTDFGSQQRDGILIDIHKLVNNQADHKFFMFTDKSSFEIIQKSKYSSKMMGITAVLLTTGEEFLA